MHSRKEYSFCHGRCATAAFRPREVDGGDQVPSPSSHAGRAPQGPTVGGGDSWGSSLPPAVTACAGSYPNAAAHEQPSGAIRGKEGLRQATRGRRKPVISRHALARHVFVEFLVGNLVELHVAGVRRSRVPSGQGWKVVFATLASCLPGRRIPTRSIFLYRSI